MKDALLETLFGSLREEAIKLGSDLIRKGLVLAQDRIRGKVSDAQILEHLAAVQDAEVRR